jgi:rubredoxin
MTMKKNEHEEETDLELLAWKICCAEVDNQCIAVAVNLVTEFAPSPTTKPTNQEVRRQSQPDARCKVCGKEIYESIKGSRFCKACGAPSGDGEPTIIKEELNPGGSGATNFRREEGIATLAPDAPNRRTPPAEGLRCFSIGYTWLRDHLDKLLAAGWTRRELFGRGRYNWCGGNWGAAWLSSWQEGHKTPSIGRRGEIIFSFMRNSREPAQHTAWPNATNPSLQGN